MLSGKQVAVFLDYDGTLSPIVNNPDDAHITPAMRETVRELSKAATTAIITGRSREKIHQFMQIDDMLYAGSHGFEIGLPGQPALAGASAAAPMLPVLQDCAGRLAADLAGVPGVIIEDNKYSVSVHYRMVRDRAKVPLVFEVVNQLLASDYPLLMTRLGKMVIEIKPRIEWHKGKALLWIMEHLNLLAPDTVPIYIGDDLTDEDAFAALGYVRRLRRSCSSSIMHARGGGGGGGRHTPHHTHTHTHTPRGVPTSLRRISLYVRAPPAVSPSTS